MIYETIMIFFMVYVVARASVEAVEKYAQLRYGSSSQIASMQSQIEKLEKETKSSNSRNINERLSALEAHLNIRIF